MSSPISERQRWWVFLTAGVVAAAVAGATVAWFQSPSASAPAAEGQQLVEAGPAILRDPAIVAMEQLPRQRAEWARMEPAQREDMFAQLVDGHARQMARKRFRIWLRGLMPFGKKASYRDKEEFLAVRWWQEISDALAAAHELSSDPAIRQRAAEAFAASQAELTAAYDRLKMPPEERLDPAELPAQNSLPDSR